MKKAKKQQIATTRARFVEVFYDIDLDKDFFDLSDIEMIYIKYAKSVFNFNGRNDLGRSELRQFYYHLQEGHRLAMKIE